MSGVEDGSRELTERERKIVGAARRKAHLLTAEVAALGLEFTPVDPEGE